MSFGNYLKDLREKAGLSQRALAEKINVSNTEISRLESGERQKPSPSILSDLASHLRVSYEEIMKEAGYFDNSTFVTEKKEQTNQFYEIMPSYLIKEGWSVRLCDTYSSLGDIWAQKEASDWVIEFKYIRYDPKNENASQLLIQKMIYDLLGRLTIYGEKLFKFSIATNNEDAYNYILQFKPKRLDYNISVIYLNLIERSVVCEDYISYASN